MIAIKTPFLGRKLLWPLVGLLLLLGYWYWIHPMDFARGSAEDWCGYDLTRQSVAEAIDRTGGPDFRLNTYVAPTGMTAAYHAWGIEISWLGSYFWRWSRDFPFLWVHLGLSLVASYLVVGWILRKMRFGPFAAWALAFTVVTLHVPRHYKMHHHFEHLLQHWVYWSLFLDAWIWQRFWRDRKWSWSLEAWRALCLMGMLTTAGYFWGPLMMEWMIVRACMLALWRRHRPEVEGSWRQAAPVVPLALFFAVIELRWFLPLARAVREVGGVPSQLGWFGPGPYLVRPLWLDDFVAWVERGWGKRIVKHVIDRPETVITIGWIYCLPGIAAWVCAWRARRSWRGLAVMLPFLVLFLVAFNYFNNDPPDLALVVQKVVPFMNFFRVASRWGLLLPQIVGIMIILAWPELTAWARGLRTRRPRLAYGLLIAFGLSSAVDFSTLIRRPVSTMPRLPDPALALLQGVREAPGTTVLDLPFCMAGGNGMCTDEQCPNYPGSVVGHCMRGWHDKNVYGIYLGRLTEEQCGFYRRAPYSAWFAAWRDQRCFTDAEWDALCTHLDERRETAAVLVYPDLWTGAGQPACQAEFARRLGRPLAEAMIARTGVRGEDQPVPYMRLQRYAPRCVGR